MKLKHLVFTLLCVPVVLLNSCQNELSGELPTINEAPVNDLEKVTSSITGVVVNENDVPVSGVTVSSSGYTATTNSYGMFRFKNIEVSKANATVKVERNGYFTAYRTFPATSGRNHSVRIKLIPKTNSGSFAAASGGTITIAGGGKMVMPANAITDATGNAYSGTVNVAMTWINPTAPDLNSTIMGDLRGITTGGQERALETYGMLGVEMTGAGGQTLKIAPGKTAELTFPVPASLQGGAPATITLWHFDEATARWKEEGSATKTGGSYVANVSHFSFWNCDAPWPQITLCMTLVNQDNVPLANTSVKIKRVNVPSSVGVGFTDSLGNLCGIVPKNEPLIMEVLGPCGTPVYSQNIGPFSVSTSLGVITVTVPGINALTITGNAVNCAGNPLTNGRVFVQLANGQWGSVLVNNGTFSITMLNCATGNINFTAIAEDIPNLVQGTPYNGSGSSGTVNIGTLTACGVSTAEFITMVIDGTTYNWTAPADSIGHFGTTAVPPYAIGSIVMGARLSGGTNSYTQFSFNHNAALGSYPLGSCTVSLPGLSTQQIVTASPLMNITEIGPISTGFISGNFNVVMRFGALDKPVACTFRVKRRV